MIIGIGTDLIQIPRIEKILVTHPTLFLDKYFSVEEFKKYENCELNSKQLASKYAKFFAAKEAFVKALGTGFNGINLRDICVCNEPSGKPVLKLEGTAAEKLRLSEANSVHLSISHEREYTVAMVTLEKL